jgi:hypothetical protein
MSPTRFLVPLLALALAAPVWAQKPAAPPSQEDVVWNALSPLAAPHVAQLHAAGVQKVVARTGRNQRDIQVLTRWGPVYFGWPKGITPGEFELSVDGPSSIYLVAPKYTAAARPMYKTAFDAVLPQAVKAADQARVNASRPKAG